MYEYEKGWWETKEGEMIKIEDMETSHIQNTINYLKRNPDFYDVYVGGWFGENDDFDFEDNSELVNKKIEELEYELKKRKNYGETKYFVIWRTIPDGEEIRSFNSLGTLEDYMEYLIKAYEGHEELEYEIFRGNRVKILNIEKNKQ